MVVSTNDVLLLLTPLILYCFSTMWERRLHGTNDMLLLHDIPTSPASAIERKKTAFDAAKKTTDQVGVLTALVAAVGFDGMFAERDNSDDVILAYSLVMLLGTTTAVICATISTFCCSACSYFLEEKIEMAFRVVSPFLGLPVALFMLQLNCLFYALLQNSRLTDASSSLLVFKLCVGCAAVFLNCFSAYLRHYALAACVPSVGQEVTHPTLSPSTSSGPRTRSRSRSKAKRTKQSS